MYRNVDVALKFFKTYKGYLIKMMGYKQSLADPCVFYKNNDDGLTLLFVLIHVNNSLLIGTKDEIKNFKEGIKKRFGFTDLGKLKKHLGVWYEEKFDKMGNDTWRLRCQR